MTTKEFNNLTFGNLVFHVEHKRLYLILGWLKTKKGVRAKPSLLSIKRVYLYTTDANKLKRAYL